MHLHVDIVTSNRFGVHESLSTGFGDAVVNTTVCQLSVDEAFGLCHVDMTALSGLKFHDDVSLSHLANIEGDVFATAKPHRKRTGIDRLGRETDLLFEWCTPSRERAPTRAINKNGRLPTTVVEVLFGPVS